MTDTSSSRHFECELSIVVPALNEQDNVGPLVEQVRTAVLDVGIDAEMIVVDDGSDDDTLNRLLSLSERYPWLSVLQRDRPMGQSASLHAGIYAARGRFIATLDADLQNDPADLPGMLDTIRNRQVDVVQGDRSANRRDHAVRRLSTWVGRIVRRLILSDPTPDTGCSTRVVRAEFAKRLPLYFRGMHRFVPIYARLLGAKIVEVPVNHRPRVEGVTKYGIRNRGMTGLVDCLAVRWMIKRYRDTTTVHMPQQGP